MGESFKAVCSLLLIVALIAAAGGWVDDRPNATTWVLRLGGPAVALLILGFLVKLQRRPDQAPDLLRERFGTYFNRDGFCFVFVVEARDSVCFLTTFYQNHRDVPSAGQLALRPASGFFLTRPNLDTVTLNIDCEPGEFGYVQMPLRIPVKLQGKTQSFEVGASVTYPAGRGKRLRFHDGLFLRANSRFGSTFRTALVLAGAAGGAIVLTRPATIKIALPAGVATDIDDAADAPVSRKLWSYTPGTELCGARP